MNLKPKKAFEVRVTEDKKVDIQKSTLLTQLMSSQHSSNIELNDESPIIKNDNQVHTLERRFKS
jgi:hypothetical protein